MTIENGVGNVIIFSNKANFWFSVYVNMKTSFYWGRIQITSVRPSITAFRNRFFGTFYGMAASSDLIPFET